MNMKLFSKFAATVLAALMLLSSTSVYAVTSTKSIYNGTTYTHNERFSTYSVINGIDVSKHQGDIDWKKVKAAGTDFAIIRVGYRGYASIGTLCKDAKYAAYIPAAYKAGVRIGIYFYSQAVSTEEAKEEADYAIELLESIKGFKREMITLPVYFDYEFAESDGKLCGRFYDAWKAGKLPPETATSIASAFCDEVEKKGYTGGVYSNLDFYTRKYNASEFEGKYSLWLAHYISPKTSYAGEYTMWQYSSKGHVDGISGNVDCDFLYVNNSFDVTDIPDMGYTGKEVKPEFEVKLNENHLIKGEDYYVTYSDNIEYGKASVKITGINDYANYSPVTKKFKIVPTPVSGLKLAERGTNTLKVKWNAHPDADGYEVWYKNSKGWNLGGKTTKKALTIKNLSTAANYLIAVKAYKTVGSKNYSGLVGQTLQTATKPSKVTKLTTSKAGSTSIKLKWKKQSCSSGYIVYRYNSSKKKYEEVATVKGGKKNYCTVSGLTPNKKYTFRVRAFKNAKEGKTLKGEKSDKYKDYTSPKTPSLVSVKAKSARRVKVKWNTVKGASGYKIMWSTTKDFSSNTKTKTVKQNVSYAEIVPTRADTKYYVRIKAYRLYNDKKHYSDYSPGKGVTTKE